MANLIIIPDVALQRLADIAMVAGYPKIDGDARMQFFGNNPILGDGTVLGDFTAVSVPGVTSYLLTGSVNQGIVTGDYDLWKWPTLTATASAAPSTPQRVNGYWVTSTYDGALLWCQTFQQPFMFRYAGDAFTLVPQFSYGENPMPRPVRGSTLTVLAQVVWGVPGGESDDTIDITASVEDANDNPVMAATTVVEVIVSDGPDDCSPSHTATLDAAASPLGTILGGGGSATVMMRTGNLGTFTVAVSEPTPACTRYLWVRTGPGSQLLVQAATGPVAVAFA